MTRAIGGRHPGVGAGAARLEPGVVRQVQRAGDDADGQRAREVEDGREPPAVRHHTGIIPCLRHGRSMTRDPSCSCWSPCGQRACPSASDPGVDAGIGRRATEHRDHRGDLAAVVGCVIGDVLQQRPSGALKPCLPCSGTPHPASSSPSAIDERLLLGLERGPLAAHEGHRRQLGARLRGRRRSCQRLSQTQSAP